MRLLGLVGSPRKDGNSYTLVKEALRSSKKVAPSAETSVVQLADVHIESCRACESCADEPFQCRIEDYFASVLAKMKEANGILLASPRYGPLGVCPSKMHALLERLTNVSYLPKHGNPEFVPPLSGKPCGLIAVSAEGRQNNLPLLHALEQYALLYRMRVIHTPDWPWVGVTGRGNEKGDVLDDEDAIKHAAKLGKLLVEALREGNE